MHHLQSMSVAFQVTTKEQESPQGTASCCIYCQQRRNCQIHSPSHIQCPMCRLQCTSRPGDSSAQSACEGAADLHGCIVGSVLQVANGVQLTLATNQPNVVQVGCFRPVVEAADQPSQYCAFGTGQCVGHVRRLMIAHNSIAVEDQRVD